MSMLGLTRKVGEQVLIGDDIIITVERIQGQTVRLLFDGPRHIPIDRPEYLVKRLRQPDSEGVENLGELL